MQTPTIVEDVTKGAAWFGTWQLQELDSDGDEVLYTVPSRARIALYDGPNPATATRVATLDSEAGADGTITLTQADNLFQIVFVLPAAITATLTAGATYYGDIRLEWAGDEEQGPDVPVKVELHILYQYAGSA